jgi:hypothetical protein
VINKQYLTAENTVYICSSSYKILFILTSPTEGNTVYLDFGENLDLSHPCLAPQSIPTTPSVVAHEPACIKSPPPASSSDPSPPPSPCHPLLPPSRGSSPHPPQLASRSRGRAPPRRFQGTPPPQGRRSVPLPRCQPSSGSSAGWRRKVRACVACLRLGPCLVRWSRAVASAVGPRAPLMAKTSYAPAFEFLGAASTNRGSVR